MRGNALSIPSRNSLSAECPLTPTREAVAQSAPDPAPQPRPTARVALLVLRRLALRRRRGSISSGREPRLPEQALLSLAYRWGSIHRGCWPPCLGPGSIKGGVCVHAGVSGVDYWTGQKASDLSVGLSQVRGTPNSEHRGEAVSRRLPC